MDTSRALHPLLSLRNCWVLLRRAPAGILIGGWLIGFLDGGLGSGLCTMFEAYFLSGAAGSAVWLPAAMALAAWCAMFVFGSWIETGLARTLTAASSGGKVALPVLISGADRLASMLVARFLAGLILLACALPFAGACVVVQARIPIHLSWFTVLVAGIVLWLALSLYVGLGLLFVRQAVALEGAGPLRAIARSWELARGRRIGLLGIEGTRTLLDLAGLCCLCVGQLASAPFSEAMRTEVFLALTRGRDPLPQGVQPA